MEVINLGEKNSNWSKKKSKTSVNPQGLSKDDKNKSPKTQLEQRAKMKNTKI